MSEIARSSRAAPLSSCRIPWDSVPIAPRVEQNINALVARPSFIVAQLAKRGIGRPFIKRLASLLRRKIFHQQNASKTKAMPHSRQVKLLKPLRIIPVPLLWMVPITSILAIAVRLFSKREMPLPRSRTRKLASVSNQTTFPKVIHARVLLFMLSSVMTSPLQSTKRAWSSFPTMPP